MHQGPEGYCSAIHFHGWSFPATNAKIRFCFAQADIAPPYNVTGTMDIEVNVAKPTPCVVLHAISMDITSVTYTPLSSAAAAAGDADAPDPVSGEAKA